MNKICKHYGLEKDEIDLLKRFLVWDPKKRITVSEALEHKYMN